MTNLLFRKARIRCIFAGVRVPGCRCTYADALTRPYLSIYAVVQAVIWIAAVMCLRFTCVVAQKARRQLIYADVVKFERWSAMEANSL